MSKLTRLVNRVTVEHSHDTREGWATVDYYVGAGRRKILIASDDGTYTTHYSAVQGIKAEEIVQEYREQNGHPEPDWESYEAELTTDQAAQIREDHPDDYVLVHNAYEQESSPGFANTDSLESAAKGDTSRYGWETACRIADLGTEYDTLLVNWAIEQQLDTVINWF